MDAFYSGNFDRALTTDSFGDAINKDYFDEAFQTYLEEPMPSQTIDYTNLDTNLDPALIGPTDDDLDSFFADNGEFETIMAGGAFHTLDGLTVNFDHNGQLQVNDPNSRVPEEFLPLGASPEVPLIPRGRALHQYDEHNYAIPSRHPDNLTAKYGITPEAYDQVDMPPPEPPSRKRKAPTYDTRASKKTKLARGHTTTSCSSQDTNSTTTPQLPNALAGFPLGDERPPASLLASVSPIPSRSPSPSRQPPPMVPTSAPQHAPQAKYTDLSHPPPPAPKEQMVVPPVNVFSSKRFKYGDDLEGRPPVNVCLPPDEDVSLSELMTFVPNTMLIPEVTRRVMRNGLPGQTAAKMQLGPVNKITGRNPITVEDRIKQQVKYAGETYYAEQREKEGKGRWLKFAKDDGAHHDLTANYFRLRSEHSVRGETYTWGHYKLKDIYDAVSEENWPKENDKLVMTQCLEFAKAHKELDLDTSHWNWIKEHINAKAPPAPAGYETRDHEAVERFTEKYPTKKALADKRKGK